MLLTILLCAAAVYRLVVLPVEDEFALHHMRLASTNAAEEVRRLVRNVENATQDGRAWGQSGLLSIDDPDGMTRLLIPIITDTPEVTSVLFAREDGREILLVKTGPTVTNFASATADLINVKGLTLTELGYDIRKPGPLGSTSPIGSHCGAGAPRFNEFVVQTRESPQEINNRLLDKKMIGGFLTFPCCKKASPRCRATT